MGNEDKSEIVNYNKQQLEHIELVQQLVLNFCCELMLESVGHDTSKFDNDEYWTFIESCSSLNNSKDGKDVNYQKFLNSEAIQKHITENKHHPEYWDKRNEMMPIIQAIIMFFDWESRSIQRGTPMSNFREFNTDKLTKQPHALNLVNYLFERLK